MNLCKTTQTGVSESSYTGTKPICTEDIISRRVLRNKVNEIEQTLLNTEGVIAEIATKHTFSDGGYYRSITIPKGTLLTGKIHRVRHRNILSKGSVSVLSEFGPQHCTAPFEFISEPWTKRVIFAHEDSVWTTFHVTTETSISKIEHEVIAPDYSEIETLEDNFLKGIENLEGLFDNVKESRADFKDVVAYCGLTLKDVWLMSINKKDQTPFTSEHPVEVKKSPIRGKGLFVTEDVAAGELLAVARLGGKRTPAGRYTNHGVLPNAEMQLVGDTDIHLISLQPIEKGTEILTDYLNNYMVSKGK